MDQPVTPFALERMFFGVQPGLFYLEILVRTVIIYLYAFFLIRLIGKRATGQFSTIEIFLIVALGSAVGDPMFYPQVPLLHSLAVITIVVSLNSMMFFASRNSDTIDRVINLKPELCVQDGVIVIAQEKLTYSEVHGLLRLAGIENLGQVRAAFLEKNGSMSVFKNQEPQPGLTIVPPTHTDNGEDDSEVRVFTTKTGDKVCSDCGAIAGTKEASECAHCTGDALVDAEVMKKGAP